MKNQNQQRTLLEQQLIEKSVKDETFRKQLLENPKEVIETETGVKFPAGIAIHVLEEKANEVFLVLPAINTETGEELTEEELTSVSGGTIGAETVETHWTYCNC